MKSLNHLSRSYDKNVILGHMVKNTGFDHLVYIQVSITWFIYRSRSFGSYIGLDHLVHVQVSTIWFICRSRPFGLYICLDHLVYIQVSTIWFIYRSRPFGLYIGLDHLAYLQVSLILFQYRFLSSGQIYVSSCNLVEILVCFCCYKKLEYWCDIKYHIQ